VQSAYDREGRVERVVRSQSPDVSRSFLGLETFPALGTIASRYRYDNLGRKVAEIAPDSTPADTLDNPVDSTFYDAAGNVERVRTRRNDNILATDTPRKTTPTPPRCTTHPTHDSRTTPTPPPTRRILPSTPRGAVTPYPASRPYSTTTKPAT
jgi:hypothetical protein